MGFQIPRSFAVSHIVIGGAYFLRLPFQSLKLRKLLSIKHNHSPQLILAGAGKTTTINAKIVHMREKRILLGDFYGYAITNLYASIRSKEFI
ncbi:MAG: hypothetical protein KKG76_13815 [Euryarchaeota archaeon]|nr:hypothetical protein [Euryarchaeota archaeon]